jgi:branched-subunit amino acid ABC-type transport system permease component
VIVWIIPMLLIAGIHRPAEHNDRDRRLLAACGAPRLAPLITAIGVSFILQNVGLRWKARRRSRSATTSSRRERSSRSATPTSADQLILPVTIPTLFLLVWLVQKTAQGKRCVRSPRQGRRGDDGHDVNKTISFTFLIAGLLAGFAGVLYALFVTNAVRHGLPPRPVRLHGRRPRWDREPSRRCWARSASV